MKVNIVLSTLIGGLVVLVSHTLAGSIQISAYGNATKSLDVALNNSSSKSGGTGRAMGGGNSQNPLEGLLSKPIRFRSSSQRESQKTPKYIVYPSASQSVISDRVSNNAVAMDRFAPGEAYGGTVYKIVKAREQKIKNGYQYQKPSAAFDDAKTDSSPPSTAPAPPPPAPPAAITVPSLPPPITPPPLPPVIVGPTPSPVTSPPAPVPTTISPPPQAPSNQYIPPSDLYLFAPNVHSHYPQLASGDVRFNGVSSYLPPPAGNSDDSPSVDSGPPADSNSSPPSPPSNQYIPPEGLFQFPPNIHSHYHPAPPEDSFQFNGISSYLPPPAGPSDAYLPPSSDDSPTSSPPSDSNDMIGTIPIGPDSPYPSYLPPSAPPQPAPPAPMIMKQPPPPMDAPPTMTKNMMASPPKDIPFDIHDHDIYYPHDHYPHDHFSHDHYPEYIFDHDHIHHHDEPPPPTTAAPPPPPPPPVDAGTARVKNYSYYYLSRTLWYVPLYFTLYFCFYVLILILRSIARHKVQYPNQWTGRSLQEMQFVTNDQVVNKADIMATFVMKQIDDFKEKYL